MDERVPAVTEPCSAGEPAEVPLDVSQDAIRSESVLSAHAEAGNALEWQKPAYAIGS